MRRIILISAVGLGLLAATTSIDAAQTASNHTSRVDACLRAHGWPNGLLALQRAELRARHPNGLIQTCGGRDAQKASKKSSCWPLATGLSSFSGRATPGWRPTRYFAS
jgi:hypothetical protein